MVADWRPHRRILGDIFVCIESCASFSFDQTLGVGTPRDPILKKYGRRRQTVARLSALARGVVTRAQIRCPCTVTLKNFDREGAGGNTRAPKV